MQKERKLVKVRSASGVKSVGGCIIGLIESGEEVEVRAVGAAALNQAYKAIIFARTVLSGKGTDLLIRPGFGETEDNKSALKATLIKG